jgi:drug/metabolite transporter (DMT)-like permease
MKPSSQARGALLVVAATAGFASLGTLAGLANEAGMGSSSFVTLRAAIGATLLAGLLALRPALWVPLAAVPPRQRLMLLAAVGINGSFNLALFGAFALATVPVTLAIYFTYPALVALASVALGRERFAPLRLAGLALAMAGVVLLLGGRLWGGADAHPLGLVLAGTAAALQASYIVIARSGFPAVSAEQAITLVLAGGAAMAAVAVVTTDEAGSLARWAGDPGAWLAVLAAAVLGTAAAKVWVLRGLRLLGGTRTAIIMLGEPLGGILLAAVVLEQSLAPLEAVGGVLIVVAALLVQRPAPGRTANE